jgi:hypothetical protein
LQRKHGAKLDAERKRRLDSVGFVWDPRQVRWEEMFSRLRNYKLKHGDCDVGCGYSDRQLVRWIVHQRSRRGRLSGQRRDRLERLGFVWAPSDEAWQRGFAALRKFRSREGHCRVPEAHIEQGYKLGAWAKQQRRARYAMAAARRRQLDAIGFWRPSIGARRHMPSPARRAV